MVGAIWSLAGICSARQVEEHVSRIREELDREREERNYFQLERDKIHTFWEITRRQLEEKKAELRNKDREMEEAEERHQVEIKVSGRRLPAPLQSLRRCWSVCAECACAVMCVSSSVWGL